MCSLLNGVKRPTRCGHVATTRQRNEAVCASSVALTLVGHSAFWILKRGDNTSKEEIRHREIDSVNTRTVTVQNAS